MSRDGHRPVLSDVQFAELRDLIYEASGILFSDQKRYLLESRLRERLRSRRLQSFEEYLHFLMYDPRKGSEMPLLLDEITTNETSFYRNPAQMAAFEREVLPALIKSQERAGERSLRIWSAGCSSGEEAYSLAMLTKRVLGPKLDQWRVEIVGTDISHAMLEQAKSGRYGEYTMRALPKGLRASHFRQIDAKTWQISDAIRAMVRFRHLNFNDRLAMRTMRGYHIIFCRNVLIYFDQPARKRLVDGLYDALVPGGSLFLGHSESLRNLSRAFTLRHHPGCLVYQRES